MTSSSPPRPWPTVGLSLALGLSVAETGLVFRNLLRGFKAGGVLGHVALAFGVYALILGAVDAVAARQGLAPRARLGLGLLTVAMFGWLSNQPLFSLGLVMLAAGLFSVLAQSRAWPLAGILWGLAWWPARPQAEPPRPPMVTPAARGPNLAVIVLDTLVRDRCSTYGYAKPTSPNLDALARRGVLMERAWSTANWSLPAHASLFSGRLPHDHGTHQREGYTLPADTLLAERLRLAGYETAGLSANPFAGIGSGLAQGFTHFEPFWRDFTAGETLFAARVHNGLTARDRDKGGAAIVGALDQWLVDRDPERSFFLFVNLMEAHGPYQEVPLAQRAAFIDAPLRALEAAGEAGHMAQIFGLDVPESLAPVNDALLDGCTLAADHL
ncbi:MAG: Choline-sulfatase, partial [Pseudomonadota bacterium]